MQVQGALPWKPKFLQNYDFKHQDAKAVNIGFFLGCLSDSVVSSKSDVYNFGILVLVVNHVILIMSFIASSSYYPICMNSESITPSLVSSV